MTTYEPKCTYYMPLVFQRTNKKISGGFCLSFKPYDKLVSMRYNFLHEKEIAYFLGISAVKRQHSYLLGRYCAKQALTALTHSSEHTTINIESGVFQQPIVSAKYSNLQVSISHSGILGAALAFPEIHPMGIDVEKIDQNKEKEMCHLMTLAEKKFVDSLAENSIFYSTLIWTVKEALSKTIHCGFMINLDMLETEKIITEKNLIRTYFKNFSQYQALSFSFNKHICSIVLPRETFLEIDTLKIKNWFLI